MIVLQSAAAPPRPARQVVATDPRGSAAVGPGNFPARQRPGLRPGSLSRGEQIQGTRLSRPGILTAILAAVSGPPGPPPARAAAPGPGHLRWILYWPDPAPDGLPPRRARFRRRRALAGYRRARWLRGRALLLYRSVSRLARDGPLTGTVGDSNNSLTRSLTRTRTSSHGSSCCCRVQAALSTDRDRCTGKSESESISPRWARPGHWNPGRDSRHRD